VPAAVGGYLPMRRAAAAVIVPTTRIDADVRPRSSVMGRTLYVNDVPFIIGVLPQLPGHAAARIPDAIILLESMALFD
jgi:hypothetical protein